jgi:hypothetical protein
MAQIINRNGKEYVFPDDFTEEQINKELENLDNPAPVQTEETEPEEERGILTDVPYQAYAGAVKGAKSAVNLIEGIAQKGKEVTGYGGWTFGENASNGFAEYHTYEDVIKNNIKLPISGDVTKVGDSAIKEALPDPDDADTALGSVTSSISQFISGWYLTAPIKPLKFTKGAKATTNFAKATTRGAVADFVAFDEETGRFVDMVNTQFPSLQNPLFDYLSSEGKDETFYEARLKNAIEGALLGGVMEGVVRGSAPFIKEQLSGFSQWMKLKRKSLTGENVDMAKLAKLEQGLVESAERNLTPSGKNSTKKLVDSIINDSATEQIGGIVRTLKDKAEAEDINKRIVDNFTGFIERAKKGEKGLNFKDIDEALDLGLSPRAYADTDFGIIVLDALQRVIRSEKKFDVMSTEIIERQATKQGYDIIQTTKMLGQLGKKMEDGLKFMYASQAIQQNLADALYKMSVGLSKGTKEFTENEAKITTALLMRLMRFDDKVASNLGRGLNLRRVLKDSNVDLDRQNILNLVKSMDTWDGDFKAFYEGIAVVKDKNMLTRIVDFIFRNKFWNRANEVWMSFALSNPKTQVINTISTANNLFLRPVATWAGSKMTWGMDDFTKAQMREQGDEALATIAGYRSYLSDAVTFMKKSFNEEDSILFAGSTKFDTNTKALGNSRLAKAVRTPLRGLTAVDEFFKQIAYRSKLMAMAVREARTQGLSTTKKTLTLPDGKQISEFDEYVAKRFKAGFDETGVIAVDKEASRFAKEVTFTKDLDGILGKVQQITNEVPIMKQILPFVKTPSNLALQAIEMTPFGLVGKNWKHTTGASRDAVRIAEVRGRVAVGTGILSLASLLSVSGLITGGYHPDKNVRRLQQSQGFQPYSIKIGDTYIEYGRLDPIGMLIGVVADYSTIYNDLNDEDRAKIENNALSFMVNLQQGAEENIGLDTKIMNGITSTYKAGFKNIASKTYLRGLIDFLKAVDGTDVDKRGAWWLQNKASSYVPNLFTKIMNDPFLRETTNTVEAFKKKLGGMDLPKTYNVLGEPIMSNQGTIGRLFNGLINPLTVKTEKQDAVLKSLVDNEINIPALERVIKDVDLTKFVNKETGMTAFEEYNELIGKSGLRKELESLIKTDRYKNAPTEIIVDENLKIQGGKKAMIYNIVKRYRDIAFSQIQFNSKYKSVMNDKISLNQAYINKEIIKSVGKATNKIPNMTQGIYDFIDQSK